MKIAVCVKQVPDTETKVRLKPDGSGVDEAGVKWVLNPYDEYAVEEAIKIKEKTSATVIVFSLGPSRCTEALRTALAMGADEARLIETDLSLDGSAVAQMMAAAIKKEGGFDLVLAGKISIDQNAASFGPTLGALLDWPHLSFINKLTLDGQQAVAEREIEGGDREVYDVTLPAVFTANKGLNQPRYASLPGIMKAKKKPLVSMTLAELDFSDEMVKTVSHSFELPAEKPPVKILQGEIESQVKELVDILREQEKVL